MEKEKKSLGFTLIELLVAVVVIGILATIGLGQFYNARRKSFDTERKQALDSVARALEMYYNDHERYPKEGDISWGGALQDAKGTVYMKKLPTDPVGADYVYETDTDGSYYRLYSTLANQEDSDYATYGQDCNGGADSCHYCVASPNERCD